MVTLCVATENVDRADMAEQLKTRGYPSDPIKTWKQSFADQELEESEAKGARDLTTAIYCQCKYRI